MKNQSGQNTNENISKISVLEVYYKTESIFLQTEHRLSFCVNLEVVNFQGRNSEIIFVGNFVQTMKPKGHFEIN